MKKKMVAALLLSMSMLCFAACGNTESAEETSQTTPSISAESVEETGEEIGVSEDSVEEEVTETEEVTEDETKDEAEEATENTRKSLPWVGATGHNALDYFLDGASATAIVMDEVSYGLDYFYFESYDAQIYEKACEIIAAGQVAYLNGETLEAENLTVESLQEMVEANEKSIIEIEFTDFSVEYEFYIRNDDYDLPFTDLQITIQPISTGSSNVYVEDENGEKWFIDEGLGYSSCFFSYLNSEIELDETKLEGDGIVGSWETDSEYFGTVGYVFYDDGTGLYMLGSDGMDITYEDLGDGKMSITMYDGEWVSDNVTYSIDGDTLTLNLGVAGSTDDTFTRK